jgi:HD-like signal output (HDOD) protein
MRLVRHLAEDLSSGQLELPSFPDVVLRIREVLADEDASVDKMVRVIGTEPALAARLLRLANSAALNRSGKPVTDLPTAITRMGVIQVRSAALSFAMAQIRDSEKCRPIAGELKDLWERATLVAAVTHVLALRVAPAMANEAMLAGLLHSVGRLYVLTRAAGHVAVAGNEAALATVMQDWHANIGKAILESWGLPAEICDAVACQDELDGQRAVDMASLAELLATGVALSGYMDDPSGLEDDIADSPWFGGMELDAEACRAILTESRDEILDLRKALG